MQTRQRARLSCGFDRRSVYCMAVQSQPAPALTGKWPAEPMTYEEFLGAADEDTHAEWVNGKVIFMSPVSSAHAELNLFLASLILNYVRERSLGKVYQDP